MEQSRRPQPIRFLLNGRPKTVDDVAPTMSVLEFLRQRERCTGTKEGCAEGDCGACTVVVGDKVRGKVEMNAVNACIQFLPTLDGKALFTVEYLRGNADAMHPVQKAMVDCHASQCGFCTPGFVMSLWALYATCVGNGNTTPPDENTVRRAITGNLCRCTGYRPIIDAGKHMLDAPLVNFDHAALSDELDRLANPVFPDAKTFGNSDQKFFAPRTLNQLTTLRAEFPNSTILAGGTDVGLWVNKQFRELGDILYTGIVEELRTISEDSTTYTIGAAVTLTDAYAALTSNFPEMNEMWERFASMPIRNVGTLGGNIANGSPIGDAMPALMALGAHVVLRSSTHARELPLESLYLGYRQSALQADEVLVNIVIPKPSSNQRFRVYKLSKRFDSDISAVCAAFAIELNGSTIKHCRIAFGGMAATPKRAASTEQSLCGREWNEVALHIAMEALMKDFAPLSDMRASAQYRMNVAKNLLQRFYLETRAEKPLPIEALNVYAGVRA